MLYKAFYYAFVLAIVSIVAGYLETVSKMKYFVALLILPAVFSAPEKRFGLNQILQFLNIQQLQADLQAAVDVLGSDPTEAACEQYLHTRLTGLADTATPLICHLFQELLHHFHIVPDTTGGKRALLGNVNFTALKCEIQTLLDVLGSEPTERVCEQHARTLFTENSLFQHAVPFICHSLQTLVSTFHLVPGGTCT